MKIEEEQVIACEEVGKKERIKRTIIRNRKDDKGSNSSFFNRDNITIGEFFVSNGFKYFLIFFVIILILFVGFYSFSNYLLVRDKKENSELNIGITNVYDSVVYIRNYKDGKVNRSGTGFIYKKDNGKGYILTNYHIVKDADSIEVILSDDKVISAKYLGGDDYFDVATISIDDKYVKQVASIGSSKDVELDSTLFTIGSSGGYDFRGTVVRGVLSDKDSLVDAVNSKEEEYTIRLLETNSLLKSGNSGGPLCDSNGIVIGINSYRFVDDKDANIGYAVPIEDVKNNLANFEKGKNIKRPSLGISAFDVSNDKALRDYALVNKVDSSLSDGVVVESVHNNSSSFGKLKKGDVIVKLNKSNVNNVSNFRYELYKHEIGDEVTIIVNREGKNKKIDIVLK